MSGFNTISLKLKEMYQMITLGGDAELELVDTLDPFSEVSLGLRSASLSTVWQQTGRQRFRVYCSCSMRPTCGVKSSKAEGRQDGPRLMQAYQARQMYSSFVMVRYV